MGKFSDGEKISLKILTFIFSAFPYMKNAVYMRKYVYVLHWCLNDMM
jgi:hypothetical protein